MLLASIFLSIDSSSSFFTLISSPERRRACRINQHSRPSSSVRILLFFDRTALYSSPAFTTFSRNSISFAIFLISLSRDVTWAKSLLTCSNSSTGLLSSSIYILMNDVMSPRTLSPTVCEKSFNALSLRKPNLSIKKF